MKHKTHLYLTLKNAYTWIMTALLLCSVGLRIAAYCVTDHAVRGGIWTAVLIPCFAVFMFLMTSLVNGEKLFFKTALAVGLFCLDLAISATQTSTSPAFTLTIWICSAFFALCYLLLTSWFANRFWLLVPLLLLAAALMAYLHMDHLLTLNYHLANIVLLLGLMFCVFGLHLHPAGQYYPTWGDRSDGRRIRSMDPMNAITPYLMVHRNESNNMFETSIEVTEIDRYIRKKRKEGLTGFGINHVLLAAYVRGVAKYPFINRFLSGQKVYSRGEDIQYCMTVKKEMVIDGSETCIKVHLNPRDTAEDVYRKFNAAVEEAKNTPLNSDMDFVAYALTLIPGVFLKFTVWLLKFLDYFGWLPPFLLEVSPFHGSVFFTSMGSLGIPPVFHHLYDFGNLPVFGAFGCKRFANEVQDDGSIVPRKYVDVKFNLDERICDGYHYAAFFRHYMRIIAHPEVLDNPPETVEQDID